MIKAMKSSHAKYYHVHLDIYEEEGEWGVRLTDAKQQKTVYNMKLDPTVAAAKKAASSVAHGYLTSEYPDQNWPVLSITWKDSD
jgi:hypothetical protein